MRLKQICIGLVLIIFTSLSFASNAEPILTIVIGTKSQYFSRSMLLNSSEIEQITIDYNRAYPGKRMIFSSIKICSLIKSYYIQSNDMLEFISTDGFYVYVPANKVLPCQKNASIAYLAIEPKEKWPLLSNQTGTTAGPFDVIWKDPERSYISNEYWAWSVNKIVVHKELDKDTLKLEPTVKNKQLLHGFNLYISHCAGCHTINHLGKAVIGPDLNYPKNPVEYYPDDKVLKQFIRNPQSIRKIENDRMSGTSEDTLNDGDLNDLISYFHYMENKK